MRSDPLRNQDDNFDEDEENHDSLRASQSSFNDRIERQSYEIISKRSVPEEEEKKEH